MLPGRAPAASLIASRRRGGTNHADYLDRAVSLATTLGAVTATASPFAHVSLSAVAEAAGVTRSTLYRLWPSQHAFWDELVSYMMTAEADSSTSAPSPFADSGATSLAAASVHESVQSLLLTDRHALMQIGVIGLPIESMSRDLVAKRRAERIAALSHELDRDLRIRGAACIDGVEVGHVAVALTMIGTGLPITGRLVRPDHLTFDSATFEGPSEAGRSLFGTLQEALRAALTTTSSAPPATQQVDDRADVVPPRRPSGRRLDYLRIAAELALDPDTDGPGIGRALRYLTLDALARELGVTRRTLANIWPDQASFRLDLLAHLLRSERGDLVQALQGTRQALSGVADADPATVIHDLGDRIHHALLQRRNDLSFLAFAPHFDDIEVSGRMRREHDQLLIAVRHSLGLLLRRIGTRPRPGVTPDHVAVAVMVVCDGANRLLRTDAALATRVDVDGRTRSLTAVALAGVLTGLTEPVDTRPQVARYLRLVS